MDWELRRRGGGPPRSAFWASLVLHTVVVVGLFLGRALQPEPLEFVTYEIQMVSLPSQQAPEEEPRPATEELVVETPDPEPPAQETDALPPPPDDDPEPEPEPEVTDPEPEPEETPPEPEPAEETTEPRTAAQPEEEAEEVATEEITVRMEGLKRDFPEYYSNILSWVNRCFVAPSGVRSLTAVLYFEITRDGTVSNARVVQRSGNPRFDLAALAAVTDCAGRGRFGPLPDDLPYEVLPVQFTFRPPGDEVYRPGTTNPLPRP